MHHHFGSKFLIHSLHSHGFCASYKEIKKFEMTAAASQGTDIPGITPGHFVQYVADNVDHNVRTLDGFNTFHGMRIIATVTAGIKHQKTAPRQDVSAKDLAGKGKINIHFFKADESAMLPLVYEELVWLTEQTTLRSWTCSGNYLGPSTHQGLGMMQAVCQGEYPGQSSITFLSR